MSNYLDTLNFSDTSYLEDLDFTKPVSLYGGEIEGENIQPDRDRSIYTRKDYKTDVFGVSQTLITPFEDKYDIRDIPVDVDGQTRYISYGEINKVDDNGNYLHPRIKKSHEDIDLKFKDNSVFDKRVEKKYVGGISPTTADKAASGYTGDVTIVNPARAAGDTIFIKMEWIKHYAN